MTRPFNFSAGPATIPLAVLNKAGAEIADWRGTGMGVMEMSHRGASFGEILNTTLATVREVLAVPADFEILFMQGGGLAQNAIVPMNLCGGAHPKVDVAVTGSWSQKSYAEAKRYADVQMAFDGKPHQFHTVAPVADWQLRADATYVHLCSNETIHGVEFQSLPDLKALGIDAPLVIDCSSHIASRAVEWDKVGVAFAGAQKNLGPAGVTMVFVRSELLNQAMAICPSAFNYQLVSNNTSMYNTPPTYSIYMIGLVFEWLQSQGGIAGIEAQNIAKSTRLYDAIDRSSLYRNEVDPAFRSRMNVPFLLADEALNERFLAEAKAANLLSLKGHKSVGGMRASIYNAMPLPGVEALVEFMQDFERRQ